jgi:ATP-dependent exoDNAse (exonuclease V) beta subunit
MTFTEWIGKTGQDDVLVVPEMPDARLIKAAFAASLRPASARFLPRITTLHQLALDIAGFQPGVIIRRQDFEILLSRSDDAAIPARFRERRFRGYRENLFAVLQLLSRGREGIDGASPELLERAGIGREGLSAVAKLVRERGYRFRGDLYREALELVRSGSFSRGNLRLQAVGGRLLSPVEQEFSDALGVRALDLPDFPRDEFRMVHENVVAREAVHMNRLERFDSVRFLSGKSLTDSFSALRRDLLNRMDKNPGTGLSGFRVIVSSASLSERLASWLPANGVPCYSSSRATMVAGLPLALELIRSAFRDDAALSVDFYNAHVSKGKSDMHVGWDVSSDEPPLTNFDLAKAADAAGNGESHYRLDWKHTGAGLPAAFRDFVRIVSRWSAPGVASRRTGARKFLAALSETYDDLRRLSGDETDRVNVFAWESQLESLFGEEAVTRDFVEYMQDSTSAASREPISLETAGVAVRTLDEFLPPAKVTWFVGLQDDEFLRDGYVNQLLGKDAWKDLENRVYGQDRDEHLRRRFGEALRTTEEAVFLLPDFGEETVVSDHVENILRILRYRRETVRVNGAPEPLSFEADFPVSVPEILRESRREAETEKKPAVESGLRVPLPEGLDVIATLRSATSVERFCTCPAAYVHDLVSRHGRFESRERYRKGNLLHSAVETLLEKHRSKGMLPTAEIFDSAWNCYAGASGLTAAKVVRSAVHSMRLSGFDTGGPTDSVCPEVESLLVCGELSELLRAEIERAGKIGPDAERSAVLSVRDALEFCIRTILWMGPTPASVTQSVAIEAELRNVLLPDAPFVLGECYVDMMFFDADGELRIVDFKSNGREYEEEILAGRKVQLLLYREILLFAAGKKDPSIFGGSGRPVAGQPVRPLPETFLARLAEGEKSLKIRAEYFAGDRPRPVPVELPYAEFLEKFLARTGTDGFFLPEKNPGCPYCTLASSCDRNAGNAADSSPYEGRYTDLPVGERIREFPEMSVRKVENTAGNGKSWIRFNGDRERAVRETSRDLVLSAGAGSGKTEVLSSRYLEILLSGQARVEEIVCITFTNRAVGEMKNRILRKLGETLDSGRYVALERGSIDLTAEERARLTQARRSFHEKNRITTFHALCKRILEEEDRAGEDADGIDLGWKMASPHEIRDELVKELSAWHASSYRETLEDQGLSDGETAIFREWLANQRFYYRGENGSSGYLESILDAVHETELTGFSLEEFLRMESETRADWEKRYREEIGEYRILKSEALALLREIERDNKKDYSETIALCERDIWKNVTGKIRVKDERAAAFKELVYARILPLPLMDEDTGSPVSSEAIEGQMTKGIAVRKATLVIAMKARDWLDAYKRRSGLLEQEDLHRFAVALLRRRTETRERLSRGIRQIMVDEFQDTNWLQDALLRLLHEPGKNGLFLVGDRKQSIYRFQRCDDRIFQERIEGAEEGNYLRLRENYRSDPLLVGWFNRYFSSANTMPDYRIIGKVRGVEETALAPEGRKTEWPVIRVAMIGYDRATDGKNSGDDFGDLGHYELDDLVRIREAHFLAGLILSNRGKGVPFSSFGILVRQYSRTAAMLKVFRQCGIPYSFQMAGKLFSLESSKEFIGLLRAAFGLDSPETFSHLPGVPGQLENLRGAASSRGAMEIAESLLYEGEYRDYLETRPDFEERVESLEQLLQEISSAARDAGGESARMFRRLGKLAEDDTASVRAWARDTVRVLTVHGAKGLEFDNVILANVSSREAEDNDLMEFLHRAGEGKRTLDLFPKNYRDRFGDAVPGSEFWWNLELRNENRRSSNRERANLLYVALTRARKNLFISVLAGNFNPEKMSESREKRRMKRLVSKSDWTSNLEENAESVCRNAAAEGAAADTGVDWIDFRRVPEIAASSCNHFIRVPKRLARPMVPSYRLRTVTEEVSEEDGNPAMADYRPVVLTSEVKAYESRELGTLAHRFMEMNIRTVAELARDNPGGLKKLAAQGIAGMTGLSGTLRETLVQMLSAALECGPFLDLVAGAEHLRSELPFLSSESSGSDGTAEVLDGVIDLLVLRGDEAVILDYKTHGGEGPLEPVLEAKYRAQVGLYARAVSRIMPGKRVRACLLVMGADRSRMISCSPL